MSLIKCPECEKEVSETADICPNCGFNVSKYVQEEKERLENEEKERQRREEREKRDAEIQAFNNTLFGTKPKRTCWIIGIIIWVCLCIWGYVYSRQITECKDRVVSLMEIYKEVDERLFDKMVNDNYWVDEYDLIYGHNLLSWFNTQYDRLNSHQKGIFSKWLETAYSMNLQEFKDTLAHYMIDENEHSSDEYVEFLKKLRQQKIQEIVDRVKIVDDSLVADGDYFYYTGQIGQERLNPTQQLWLTLWLRDMIKNRKNIAL